MNNKVTIAIPAFNVASTISSALKSLFGQTTAGGIIVLDNNSTDATQKILEDYQQQNKINVLYNKQNIGGEANFERCLHIGDGEYKAIYHADDVYEPTIVEKELAFLDAHPECGAVITRANFINDAGNIVGCSKTFKQLNIAEKEFKIFDAISLIKKLVRYGNFLITPSAMFRTDIAKNQIKTWNGAMFGTSADLDVWLRVAELGSLGFLEEPLMSYRLSYKQGGYNYNKTRIEKSDFLRVVEYWIEKPIIKSQLNSEDYFYFEGLQRIDQLQCGIRAYLQGSNDIGNKLLAGTFHQSFFVSSRRKYLVLWLLSLGLKYRITRKILKPILKKSLLKKYLG